MSNRNFHLLRVVALVAVAMAVAACASKSKHSQEPAKLTEIQSSAKIEKLWSASIGGDAPKLRLGLSLAAAGDAVFVANHDGKVFAFNQADGKTLWSTATKLKLSGGPGTGEGLVVAGAGHGDIIALDAATGAVKWKSYINSEILAAPVIAGQFVMLRTVDGRIVALRTSDGTQLWSAEQQVPRLSLRGTARPTIVGDVTLSGFDNGRVQALQVANGAAIWDVTISPSSGRTELERLNDIDTALAVQGKDVYVVTFQGKVARIDLETGQVQWSRDASSYSGLALDTDGLYVTSSDGAVMKIGSRNGVELWQQQVLSHRRLSAPAVLGELVVVGDLDGYVHFFDRATGTLAARIHALSSRVVAEPVVSGDRLFMLDVSGHLVALRATPVAAGTGTTTSVGDGGQERSAPSTHPR